MAKNTPPKKNDHSKIPLLSSTLVRHDFNSMHPEDVAKVIEMVTHHPDYMKRQEKRNTMFDALQRTPVGQARAALLKQIESQDRWMADFLFGNLVNIARKVPHCTTHGFHELMENLNLDDPDVLREAAQLSMDLDQLTFMSDFIEDRLTQVKARIKKLFADTFEFTQFDGILASLKQLEGTLTRTRDTGDEEEQALFAEYADSIAEYLRKRMATYTTKLCKLHGKKDLTEITSLRR